MAFDTIYAEGQRRYVKVYRGYARQFLEQLQKPNVEYIAGLSPAIAIEQRTAGGNPRSTVGTQTEIYDYLRLFARIGHPHCCQCHQPTKTEFTEMVDSVMRLPRGSPIQLLAPLIREEKENIKIFLNRFKRQVSSAVVLTEKSV